jgi:hypothetical protein
MIHVKGSCQSPYWALNILDIQKISFFTETLIPLDEGEMKKKRRKVRFYPIKVDFYI